MFDIQARHASLVGVLRQIAAGTVSDPQSWAQRIVAGTEAQNCDPDVCAICGEIYCPGCELAAVEEVMVLARPLTEGEASDA